MSVSFPISEERNLVFQIKDDVNCRVFIEILLQIEEISF